MSVLPHVIGAAQRGSLTEPQVGKEIPGLGLYEPEDETLRQLRVIDPDLANSVTRMVGTLTLFAETNDANLDEAHDRHATATRDADETYRQELAVAERLFAQAKQLAVDKQLQAKRRADDGLQQNTNESNQVATALSEAHRRLDSAVVSVVALRTERTELEPKVQKAEGTERELQSVFEREKETFLTLGNELVAVESKIKSQRAEQDSQDQGYLGIDEQLQAMREKGDSGTALLELASTIDDFRTLSVAEMQSLRHEELRIKKSIGELAVTHAENDAKIKAVEYTLEQYRLRLEAIEHELGQKYDEIAVLEKQIHDMQLTPETSIDAVQLSTGPAADEADDIQLVDEDRKPETSGIGAAVTFLVGGASLQPLNPDGATA